MAEQFGSPTDKEGQNNGEGFGGGASDNDGAAPDLAITAEELAALKKRDESAQAHITQLETENLDLREEKSELSNALAGATTLDDVINKIGTGDGQEGQPLDLDSAVERVEQRLQQKANEKTQTQNWNDVYAKVTEIYGDWDKANEEIQRRASTLDMSAQEASSLARRNPGAFYELFLPKSNPSPAQSSTSSAAGRQQTSDQPSPNAGEVRDREYYKEMRRKNGRKYWTEAVQKQYRVDRETWSN